MSIDLWQDVIVTVVAFACGTLVVRRVLGLVAREKPGCANCASSRAACAAPQTVGTSGPISMASIRRRGVTPSSP